MIVLKSNTAIGPVAVGDYYLAEYPDSIDCQRTRWRLNNDVDVNGNPLNSATLVTQPTNGSLDFSADGSFTYTPNPEFSGSDTFTYIALTDWKIPMSRW